MPRSSHPIESPTPSRIRALLFSHKTEPTYSSYDLPTMMRFTLHTVTCTKDGEDIRNIARDDWRTNEAPGKFAIPEAGLADLTISAFSTRPSYYPEPKLIGWSVEYRDVFSVGRAGAEIMARSLGAIERYMEKRREIDGEPESFGAYCARVGQAIGATAMLFESDHRGSSYAQRTYISLPLGQGAAKINHLFAIYCEQNAQEAVAS